MAESAYHMEALRRQRVIDRKRAALDKMVNGGSQDTGPNVEQANAKNPILFSGPGDYDTNRCRGSRPQQPNREMGVVLQEVVHDPNFNYRILKEEGDPPLHVDPIYRIMYPGAVVYKDESD
ncbi:uncharacterized protein LOC128164572 isoform X3 [Crassostrea angulata]|uniref:uncharacterized protein isoform X3 n=2 Tax=Magallana gigas TaxID=29159 RepID=UPI0022B198F4|nr:uncharacterized protein LOC128164572 isoform X3 [Crassostrea angulata]